MNVWEWVDEFESRARADGDEQRLRLVHLHPEAYALRHANPDQMLVLCEEGRRLAVSLHEPWWVLFYEHWAIETHIYYKDDYRHILDRVVRATLECRKPAYDQHPLRFNIWCNLVAAYLCIDPRGYAGQVRRALDYLESLMPEEGEEKYLLLARRQWFAWELDRLDESEALSQRLLALADADTDRHLALHHTVGVYAHLCRLAHRRSDWDRLAEHAVTGEELARRRGARFELALFLLWQALAARHEGREEDARRQQRLATAQMARLGKSPDDAWFDALAAYHELGDSLAAALRTRDRQLELIRDKGQFDSEWKCRLQRCRLLVKMGRPVDEEAAAAREAAGQLRDSAFALGQLDQVLRGDPGC
jgi:hypothetical protein